MKNVLFELPKDKKKLIRKLALHQVLYDRELLNGVFRIFDEVEQKGDVAVKSATQIYDKVDLSNIKLSESYVDTCTSSLSSSLRNAIENGIRNIKEVNNVLMPDLYWEKQIRPGTMIGEKVTPLESVGLWIPARKGPLISTALMLVVAAKVAGVETIIVGMPPLKIGLGDPGTIAAARLAGASDFVVGNGVAVIAGFSIGTESIPEVKGIFGPGPGAIAAAMSVAFSYGKRTATGIGPTESAIIADDSANPKILAYDLISESEHGPDSSSILVTPSYDLAKEVEKHLNDVIEEVEGKQKNVLRTVFGNDGMGAIVVTPDINSACDFVNEYAPEHLMVVFKEKKRDRIIDRIKNAGEILIGESTPFSAGNYAIGITAVLPTNGFAKIFSGITCKDMIKQSTVGMLTKEALKELYPTIKEIGEYEGLPCHVKATQIRIEN